MKRWFKYIGYFVITIIVLTLATIWYWGRKQTIDFSSAFPKTLYYCGREITSKDKEYIELFAWLKNNKTGWVNTPASYVPVNIFRSSKISINVLKSGVIVNYYSPSSYEWGQVSRGKNEKELLINCEQPTPHQAGR